jgi:hypothetical protein
MSHQPTIPPKDELDFLFDSPPSASQGKHQVSSTTGSTTTTTEDDFLQMLGEVRLYGRGGGREGEEEKMEHRNNFTT